MAGCLRAGKPHGPVYKGVHVCSCGAESGSQDIELPACSITNSLAVHYLAYHRHEIGKDEIGRVLAEIHWCTARLNVLAADPTEAELQKPKRIPLPEGTHFTAFTERRFYEPKAGPGGLHSGEADPSAKAVLRTLVMKKGNGRS